MKGSVGKVIVVVFCSVAFLVIGVMFVATLFMRSEEDVALEEKTVVFIPPTEQEIIANYETTVLKQRDRIEHSVFSKVNRYNTLLQIFEANKESQDEDLFDEAVDAYIGLCSMVTSGGDSITSIAKYEAVNAHVENPILDYDYGWEDNARARFYQGVKVADDFFDLVSGVERLLWGEKLLPEGMVAPEPLPSSFWHIEEAIPAYVGSPRFIEDQARDLYSNAVYVYATLSDANNQKKVQDIALYNEWAGRHTEVLEGRRFFDHYPMEL